MNRIPDSVIEVVSTALGSQYSKRDHLRRVFALADAPVEPFDFRGITEHNADRCRESLRLANSVSEQPLKVLGRVIEETMAEYSAPEFESHLPSEVRTELRARWEQRRTSIGQALARVGLAYFPGGVVRAGGEGAASHDLAEMLRNRDLPLVEAEFEAGIRKIESEPRDAATTAATILEALAVEILRAQDDVPIPKDKALKKLWKAVKKVDSLNLDPSKLGDERLRAMVGALTTIVESIAPFRNARSSSHPTEKPAPPHVARLAVHAAHAVCVYLLEIWEGPAKEKDS